MSLPAGLLISPRPTFFGADGITPLAFGKLSSFAAGTDTPLPLFADADLSTAYDNPLELDALGQAGPVYLSPLAYKLLLTDADDVPIPGWPVDDVSSPGLPDPTPAPSSDPTVETLEVLTTSVPTDGTNETTLWLVSIPGDTLAALGDALELDLAGTQEGGDTGEVIVSFGGIDIADFAALTVAGFQVWWALHVKIVRVDATTVRCICEIEWLTLLGEQYHEVTSVTLADDQPLQITAQVASDGIITATVGTLRWFQGPA